jgi:abortive infection bacteriophage resistance protein
MPLSKYSKPQISIIEQLALLKDEGLIIEDEAHAIHILQNISLFRLKSYLKPLRIPRSKSFKPEVTFEQAYNLYKFDSQLRKLICSELEKIEVSIRTQLSLVLGETDGIYWFANSSNFRNESQHNLLLNKLREELHRSDDDSIVMFQQMYDNPFPPSWMTFEISSFGTLSMIYRQLKSGHARRQVAAFYGLSDTVMESWLHSIVYVRNICAHHSRLWNRRLSINALIPRRTKFPFVSVPKDTKRVYYVLSLILYFLQTVNPRNTLRPRLYNLLQEYPTVDVQAMGFPEHWTEEILWQI